MLRIAVLVASALALLPSLARAQDKGYFSRGEKQLTFQEEGSRSKNERIALAAVFGAGILAAGVGTYYLLDSKSRSDELSASGTHTGLAWSAALESSRKEAISSGTIATVSYGLAGALVLAGVVTFIVTAPDKEVGYQNWQTRSFVVPTEDGVLAGQGWTF